MCCASHGVIQALQRAGPALGRSGPRLGYSDQAHLIAEFHAFAGDTPSGYWRARSRSGIICLCPGKILQARPRRAALGQPRGTHGSRNGPDPDRPLRSRHGRGPSFFVGGLWYSPALFARPWLQDCRLRETDLVGAGPVFAGAFACAMLEALVLTMFVDPHADVVAGAVAGLLIGLAGSPRRSPPPFCSSADHVDCWRSTPAITS
nr:DUF1761 domain-containing protein [Nannocystis sp.]